MTNRTKYFVFGAVALLILGLAGGLVAYYVGIPALRALSGDPDELRYVPEDASLVAFANVREVMDSDVRRQVQDTLSTRQGARNVEGRRRFEEETGINVETDIERVVAYLRPTAERGKAAHALVLARGRFDEGRIEQSMQQHGSVVEAYHGKRLIVRRADGRVAAPPDSTSPNPESRAPNPDSHPEMALAFIESGLVAVGTGEAVRQAIDLQSRSGPTITKDEQFMTLVHDSDDGSAWAVGRFDRLVGHVPLPDAVVRNLPPITFFAASGSINGGVSGTLRTQARDDEAAQQLHDVVRGFVALGKLQTSSWPELQTVLQSLQLRADGKTLVLSFVLPTSALRALAAREPQGGAQ